MRRASRGSRPVVVVALEVALVEALGVDSPVPEHGNFWQFFYWDKLPLAAQPKAARLRMRITTFYFSFPFLSGLRLITTCSAEKSKVGFHDSVVPARYFHLFSHLGPRVRLNIVLKHLQINKTSHITSSRVLPHLCLWFPGSSPSHQ